MFNNDMLFCLLNSCESSTCSISKLTSSMYLYQIAGFDFKLRYKIIYNGISSRDLNSYISEVIAQGYIYESNDGIALTDLGKSTLNDFVGTASEFELVDLVQKVCNLCSSDDLNSICITNIMIQEVEEKYGVSGLIEQKQKIIDTLTRLLNDFSLEDFNYSVGLIHKLKGVNK